MENITFIDLKLSTAWKGMDKNTVRVKLAKKDKYIIFNKTVTKELSKRKVTHCNIGVGDESGSLYFVFNRIKGFEIADPSKYKLYVLRGKPLLQFVAEHFNLTENTDMCISDNIANDESYVTYKVSLRKEDGSSVPKTKTKPAEADEKAPKKDDLVNRRKFEELDATVQEMLELNGTELEDLNFTLEGGIKGTINQYGNLGNVYASNPEELIHRERGVGKRKVMFLKNLFSSFGLKWGN